MNSNIIKTTQIIKKLKVRVKFLLAREDSVTHKFCLKRGFSYGIVIRRSFLAAPT